jgi:hypothetical protein
MRLLNVDADGSLANPVVLGVVIAWAALVLVLSGVASLAWARSRVAEDPAARGRGVAAVLFLVAVLLITPFAEFVALNLVYILDASLRGGHISSVGFLGGRWTLLGWVLPPWTAAVAGWAFVRVRRSGGSRQATPSAGAKRGTTTA